MKSNKIVLGFCILLFSAFLLIRMISEDMKVVSLLKQNYDKNDVEIIEGDNYIRYSSDINDLEDITWINEDVVQLKGLKANEEEAYTFQLNYNEKKLLKDCNDLERFYCKYFNENIEYTYEIDKDNYLVYINGEKEKGLYHARKDIKPKLLSYNLILDGELLFKLSDNNEKVAYYDVDDKAIKVYNFINGKEIDIDKDVNSHMLNNFKKIINFSNDGGYLTIESINIENYKESYFSVYGADSGKVYVEELLGTNPVWGKDKLTIAFNYMEDNSVANNKNTTIENLVADRMGFYNLKTRKIKYAQNMENGYKVMKPALWKNDNEILMIVGKYSKEENKYFFNNIYSISLKNDTLTDLQGYFTDTNNLHVDFDIALAGNNLCIASYSEEKQENVIKIIELDEREVKEFENIQEFVINKDDNDGKSVYKYVDLNKLLYISSNSLYITDSRSNHLTYRSNGTINGIYESPERSKLLITSKVGEKLEFAVVKL